MKTEIKEPHGRETYIADFGEVNYNSIYRDIFSPLNVGLRICRNTYHIYNQLHDKKKYKMPGGRNFEL